MAESKVSDAAELGDVTTSKVFSKGKRATVVSAHSSGSDIGSEHDPDEPGYDQITGIGKITPSIDREAYLQCFRDLMNEKSTLLVKNSILQRRLAEYYKKRKLDHVLKEVENTGGIDLEEKYHQKLLAYEELRDREDVEIAEITAKVEEGERFLDERLHDATEKFQNLQQLEKHTGLGLIYSKKGKPIADKTVERLLHVQRRKREQTSTLRLRYVRARNAVSELDATVRKLETLGPGLRVAHYEQLRIDNQNYMDKIEERDDELTKNRNKCTEHNQILAHIREKMHHTDEIIDITECDLGDAEMEWLRAREDLNVVKSRRDSLRIQMGLERQKAGLLTKRDLLRDYEAAADEVQDLRAKKYVLEERIKRNSTKIREARKIIRQGVGSQQEYSDREDDMTTGFSSTEALSTPIVTRPRKSEAKKYDLN